MIIDTSALIAVERTGDELGAVLIPFAGEDVALPAIVWAELLVGVRLAGNADVAARRRAKLEQIRLRVPIIEFDARTAEHYADIFSECAKNGCPIPQNDMAVAATARCLACRVLVGRQNEKHFRCVPGLELAVLPC